MNRHRRIFFTLLSLAFISSFGRLAFSQEDLNPQDEKFEDRVARIYKKFNQTEISNAEWDKIAGPKISESYILQEGDTLWDISESFFGNGFYWPKVWQLNDKITNPHIIKSGNTLKFSPGSGVTPPSLNVEQGEVEQKLTEENEDTVDTEEVLVKDDNKPEEPVKSQLIIPKGRSRREPLAKIPESFPEWRTKIGEFDENGFAKDTVRKIIDLRKDQLVPIVATENEWEGVGKIYEMEGDMGQAATYQKVFVTLNAGVKKGDIFTVFSHGGNIKDFVDGVTVGKELNIKGTIKIIEPIGGKVDTYTALVTRTVSPILVGDSLAGGDLLVSADFNSEGPMSNVAARVLELEIGGPKLFTLHQSLFLNRGAKDGLQVGAMLNVFKNFSVRSTDSKLNFDSTIVAKIKVVNVSENVATAVVIKSIDVVRPGDETGVVPSSGIPSDENTPSEAMDVPES